MRKLLLIGLLALGSISAHAQFSFRNMPSSQTIKQVYDSGYALEVTVENPAGIRIDSGVKEVRVSSYPFGGEKCYLRLKTTRQNDALIKKGTKFTLHSISKLHYDSRGSVLSLITHNEQTLIEGIRIAREEDYAFRLRTAQTACGEALSFKVVENSSLEVIQ